MISYSLPRRNSFFGLCYLARSVVSQMIPGVDIDDWSQDHRMTVSKTRVSVRNFPLHYTMDFLRESSVRSPDLQSARLNIMVQAH